MKRLLLAMAILITGTTIFHALRHSTILYQRQAAETRETWMTQTQRLAQARIQLAGVEERVRFPQENLKSQNQMAGPQVADSLLSMTGRTNLSAAQCEQLLAELNFNWNTTGDYLIVSKATLHAVLLNGIRGMKLNSAACDVLAITPDEQARIEAMTQSLGETYKTWAEARLQREEPSGDVVVKYTIPEDAQFSQTLSNQFTNEIFGTLGKERGDLLLNYSASWMTARGMNGGSNDSLTVKRYQVGDETRLNFESRTAGSVISSGGSPYQPFPESFLPIFPNGWSDLAKREGIDLPKEIKQVRN
jgi:hypothetical protein